MRKILAGFVLLVLMLFTPHAVLATSGACSYHGGVDCGAGAGVYGQVICNDGWTGSSVSYDSMLECGGGYDDTTPDCPIMSTYDYTTGSCTCMSGYVADGSTCISEDESCENQIGLMSDYDVLTGNCECMSGYVLDGGQCTDADTVCEDRLGFGSNYDSLSNTCQCDGGYSINSSGQCEDDTDLYAPPIVPDPIEAPTCPENSSLLGGQCDCDDGYVLSSDKSSCITYDQSCQDQYGANSYGDASYCYCSPGYQWNSGKTSCEVAIDPAVNAPTPVQPAANPVRAQENNTLLTLPAQTKKVAAEKLPSVTPTPNQSIQPTISPTPSAVPTPAPATSEATASKQSIIKKVGGLFLNIAKKIRGWF